MFYTFLQAMPAGDAPNALNGRLGEHLDSLIVFGETMLWGGTRPSGETVTGAGGQLLGLACALGAIFAVIMAGRMAYRSMTEGKPIDVLELLRPILFALILANWYGLTAGLYGIVRPIENRFRSVYVWSNDRVDSLRDRRLLLLHMVEGEIEQERAEAVISEIRQRYGIKETEEEQQEQVADGDITEQGMGAAYTDAQFGDVLNDDVSNEADTEEHGNFSLPDLFDQAMLFHWVEGGIIWVGEVIWSVSLYVIFLVKYLFLYVLLMFGPVYIICSVTETWRNSWSEWLGRFVSAALFGMAAYMALIFGLMIIEAAVNSDIYAMEYAMLDDERFESYVAKVSSLEGWDNLALYVVAVLVTAVTLGLSFEIASLVFPSDLSRGAGNFFTGMMKFIKTKAHQAQEIAKEQAAAAAVTVLTGSAATAAFVTKKMAEKAEEEREHDPIADVERYQDSGGSAQPDQPDTPGPSGGGTAASSASARTAADDDWVHAAKQEDIRQKAEKDFERAMGGADNPAVKLNRMTEDAYRWADRMAYLGAAGNAQRQCIEDIMAQIRDESRLQEAEAQGIKDSFVKLREARLAENRFLLDMVLHQGRQTNSSLTVRQKLAIKLFGETRAVNHRIIGGKGLKQKHMHGTPRLTSWGALFGLDTMTSSRQERQMLKRLGLYRHILVAEALRRLANSTLAPRYRPATKLMGLTLRKEKWIFRNMLHRKLYYSCLRNIASTEALIALRCRGILADRDIHVNEAGRAIHLPGADMYWRRDFEPEAYWQAVKRTGDGSLSDDRLKWFVERYMDMEQARKLKLELEVFESLRRVSEADEYVMERQLKATDEHEIRLWQDMNDDYLVFQRTKKLLDKLIKMNEK